MTEPSMIERLARTLCWNLAGRQDPTDYRTMAHVDAHWRDSLPLARAAIEAMREPTEEMLRASPIIGTGINADGQWGTNSEPARIVWRAMIDAALGDDQSARQSDAAER